MSASITVPSALLLRALAPRAGADTRNLPSSSGDALDREGGCAESPIGSAAILCCAMEGLGNRSALDIASSSAKNRVERRRNISQTSRSNRVQYGGTGLALARNSPATLSPGSTRYHLTSPPSLASPFPPGI